MLIFARRSYAASGHPLSVFLYFVAVIFLSMASFHPILSSLSFIASLILLYSLAGIKTMLKRAAFSILMVVSFLVINMILTRRGLTPLFDLFGEAVTLEAILAGICTALSFCAVICWFSSLNLLITTDRILALTGGILPAFSLLFCMVLRFVPLFSRQAERISSARAGAFGSDGKKVKNAASTFSVLTTWALENSIDTADSMHSRGYASAKRTNSAKQRFSVRDVLFLIFTVTAFAVFAYALFSGSFSVWFYPTFYIMPIDAVQLFGIIASALLLFILPIITLWEVAKWRSLK